MSRAPLLLVAAALAVLPFLACTGGASDPPAAPPASDRALTVCPEPRPEICTQDYLPVCATLESGGRKTYSNGCGACTSPEVVGWVEGECP